MLLIIVGFFLGACTLSFIHQIGTGGLVCYIVGSVETAHTCLHPSIYYGLLAISAAMIVIGLALLIRKNGRAARP